MSDLSSLYINQSNPVSLHVLGVNSQSLNVKNASNSNLYLFPVNLSPSANDIIKFNADGTSLFASISSSLPADVLRNSSESTMSEGSIIIASNGTENDCIPSNIVSTNETSHLAIIKGDLSVQNYVDPSKKIDITVDSSTIAQFQNASSYNYDNSLTINAVPVLTSVPSNYLNNVTDSTLGNGVICVGNDTNAGDVTPSTVIQTVEGSSTLIVNNTVANPSGNLILYPDSGIVNIVDGSNTASWSISGTDVLIGNTGAQTAMSLNNSNDVTFSRNILMSAGSLNCNLGRNVTFQSTDGLTYFTINCDNSGVATFATASSYNFSNVVNISGLPAQAITSGPTSSRPPYAGQPVGFSYFDTDLVIPIWATSGGYVNSVGVVV